MVRLFLLAAICQLSYGQWAWTTGGSGLTALSYNGASVFVPQYFVAAVARGAGSDCSSPTGIQMGSPASFTSDSITWTTAGLATYVVAYSSPDAATLKISAVITSLDATNNFCWIEVNPISLQPPSPGFPDQGVGYKLQYDNYWAFLDPGLAASWATWMTQTTTRAVEGQWTPWSGTTGQYLTMRTHSYTGPNPPIGSYGGYLQPAPILPLGSYELDAFIRVGAPGIALSGLAPESLAARKTGLPFTLPWPDRRPISLMFTSATPNITATNPRGYFNGSLNALNPTAFAAAMAANTAAIIANSATLNSQGVLIYDAEGTEFAWVYLGDPTLIPLVAPEMDANIDTAVAAFKAAGLKVGFTLRGQHIGAGASLPGTCFADTTKDGIFGDVWIDTTKAPGASNRTKDCFPANTWVDDGATGTQFLQTYLRSLAAIETELKRKIDYCLARWGNDTVSFFYVDSSTDHSNAGWDPQLWRDLVAAYPGKLFLPEFTLPGSRAIVAQDTPTVAAENPNITAQDERLVYQFHSNVPGSSAGIARGDIPLAAAWYNSSDLTDVPANMAASATINSAMLILDSATGRYRSFSAKPSTAYTFPLVFRVYFAAASGGLAASTTYCDQRGVTRCVQSGVPTGTASISLSGMTVCQKRYFTDTDVPISQGAAETL